MVKIVVLLTEGLDNGHTLQGRVVSPPMSPICNDLFRIRIQTSVSFRIRLENYSSSRTGPQKKGLNIVITKLSLGNTTVWVYQ